MSNFVILQNTTVLYLPPHTTSKIQLYGEGIIRNLKAYYWRRLNWLFFQRIEDKVKDAEKIDVLQAIQIVVVVWTSDVQF